MPIQPETVDALLESHDELRLAIQACFACIMKNELLDSLDAFMFAQGVAEGFAQRADAVRMQVTRESLIHLC